MPHLHRGRYRAEANLALESMGTLCLAGPEAESPQAACPLGNSKAGEPGYDHATAGCCREFSQAELTRAGSAGRLRARR
jgi:hypothetical protein